MAMSLHGSSFVGTVPLNTALPTIYGVPIVGQTITASTGGWSNSPTSYAYQWQREGSNIAGATGSTYTLAAADLSAVITVQVTATNGAGASLPAIGFLAGLINIMPLGDSLTQGFNSPGGYRAPLWTRLQNDGYNIAYVGSDTSNGVAGLPFSNHEGHGGYTISGAGVGGTTNIQYGIDALGWLSVNPDIILLLIGINDFFASRTTAQANTDYSALLDDILGKLPSVKIICASLAQQGSAWVDTFDANLITLVGTKGPRVSFVDIHNALTSADLLPDNTHPNQGGYNKIAPVWEARIKLAAPLALGPIIGTTAFYVSQSTGLDTNAGTQAAPWKTIAKVNAQPFAPGTSVLFKRGDVWRIGDPAGLDAQLAPSVSGTAGNHIVFDAYGIGANPIWQASTDASQTSNWTNIGTNLWQSVQTFPPLVSNGLPFNNANEIGNIVWGLSPLGGSAPAAALAGTAGVMAPFGSTTATLTANATQGNWLFKTTAGAGQWTVQVYSIGNPATAMPGIQLVQDKSIVNTAHSFLTFQNLTLQFSAAGMFQFTNATDITIRDSVVQWIGGGNLGGGDTTRYGDGLDVGGVWSNILVERSFWYQGYDGFFTPQAITASSSNIIVRNNVFSRWGASFMGIIGHPSSPFTIDGFQVYNNTADNAVAWSQNQRPNGNAQFGFTLSINTNVTFTNFVMENNSWSVDVFSSTILGGKESTTGAGFILSGFVTPIIDYNLWSAGVGNLTVFTASTDGNESLAVWAPGTAPGFTHAAHEVHGLIDVVPNYTNQPGNDLTPAGGSPLLGAGVDLFGAGVVWDFNKKPRPASGPFTIGAFQ